VDCGHGQRQGPGSRERASAEGVDALREGSESELCARNAMNATEIIFACYESVRRRGRVDLPLTITNNPLVDLVERGEIKPRPKG